MAHSLRLRLISGFSAALLLVIPLTSSASSSEIQMLKKQMSKAVKIADALQSFRHEACAYADESAPTKKEITKCKREVNRIFLKIRTPLRGLPSDEIDGMDDFVVAAQDCKRSICENIPEIIDALHVSIGSADDEESFIGSLQVNIDLLEAEEMEEDDSDSEIIDPLFHQSSKTSTDGKRTGIIDPLFKPTSIIDPLFKPTSIVDPAFKPVTRDAGIIDPLFMPATR